MFPHFVRRLRAALPGCAALLLAATPAAAQQDVRPFQAQEIQPYQTAEPATSLDGTYDLTAVSGRRLPVRTPSEYGVLRSGLLQIRGARYGLVYVYGEGSEIRIKGSIGVRAGPGRFEFRPETPGIAGASATYSNGEIVSVIDGGFGIRNARFVFTRRGTEPGPTDDDVPSTPRPAPARPSAACPAARAGNLVEPLSNGLELSWSLGDIKEHFGVIEAGWDSRSARFDGFHVAAGGPALKIWHLHLTGAGVCLNSGIRPGSTRADVQRVFGQSYSATHGQYKLTFEYAGDRLIDIGIDPAAGDFTPYRRTAPSPNPAPTPRPDPAPTPQPQPQPQPGALILGTWWGVQSMTQIEVKADGTYSSPNGGKGTWRMSGRDIVFTGALAGWNQGRAKLTEGGWIEFLWKDASGAAYLFQLVRR